MKTCYIIKEVVSYKSKNLPMPDWCKNVCVYTDLSKALAALHKMSVTRSSKSVMSDTGYQFSYESEYEYPYNIGTMPAMPAKITISIDEKPMVD
ncbi:MAG: hypothetical protein KBT34_10475 [Prevotella sp.]|nr:hypothetical protein [Candidatus Prevotella equi]